MVKDNGGQDVRATSGQQRLTLLTRFTIVFHSTGVLIAMSFGHLICHPLVLIRMPTVRSNFHICRGLFRPHSVLMYPHLASRTIYIRTVSFTTAFDSSNKREVDDFVANSGGFFFPEREKRSTRTPARNAFENSPENMSWQELHIGIKAGIKRSKRPR